MILVNAVLAAEGKLARMKRMTLAVTAGIAMVALGIAAATRSLMQPPDDETVAVSQGEIEVRIDGAQMFDGWTYDETTKEIVFDSATYPERGALLRVDYLMAVSCPE